MTSRSRATDPVLDAWIDERLDDAAFAKQLDARASDKLSRLLTATLSTMPMMTHQEAERVLDKVRASVVLRRRAALSSRRWLAIAASLLAAVAASIAIAPGRLHGPSPSAKAVMLRQVIFRCPDGKKPVYFRLQLYRTTEETRATSSHP